MVKMEPMRLADVKKKQRKEAKMPGFWPGYPAKFQCHLMRMERPEEEEVESVAEWNQKFFLEYKV